MSAVRLTTIEGEDDVAGTNNEQNARTTPPWYGSGIRKSNTGMRPSQTLALMSAWPCWWIGNTAGERTGV